MQEKETRNRISKINQLPDDIKSQLNVLLREGSMTQTAIREQINALIDADEHKISRNGLSRYSQAFHHGMQKYKHAQQLTQQWVQQFGEMPQTDIARSLIEIGKSQIFDIQMAALESQEPLCPKVIGHLALAIKRLQEAQSGSVKLEKEIRKQALDDAEKIVTETSARLGLSKETQQAFKMSFLGLQQ